MGQLNFNKHICQNDWDKMKGRMREAFCSFVLFGDTLFGSQSISKILQRSLESVFRHQSIFQSIAALVRIP